MRERAYAERLLSIIVEEEGIEWIESNQDVLTYWGEYLRRCLNANQLFAFATLARPNVYNGGNRRHVNQ